MSLSPRTLHLRGDGEANTKQTPDEVPDDSQVFGLKQLWVVLPFAEIQKAEGGLGFALFPSAFVVEVEIVHRGPC